MWKAGNTGLPTKERLEQVKIFTPQQCELCGCFRENANHLFFNCQFTVDVFNQLGLDSGWPQIPEEANLDSFRENLSICHERLGAKKTSDLAMVWWFI